jgi:tetratricopeptide (TPR) repeat protein
MNEVKAFVGHSFAAEDKGVVSEFLEYFNQITGLFPAFTWQHAEASEPRELREKVLRMLDGKNTFIGICTRKERVAEDKAFVPALLAPSILKVSEGHLQWKTSDWVLQEIGLAVGRGMSLILLVEKGVREPGGLSGDVEYILFERDSVSNSFGKLLEMVRALSPSPKSTGVTADDVIPSEDLEAPKAELSTPEHPTSEWSRERYRRAYFMRLFEGDAEGAARISEDYLKTPLAAEGEEAAEWESESNWISLVYGKGGSVERLRELAKEHPASWKISSHLAKALNHFGEHEEAAFIHNAAAAIAKKPSDVTGQLCAAAEQQARAGALALAYETVERAKMVDGSDVTDRKKILEALQEIGTLAKDDDLVVEAMEGLVELNPEDADVRFSLAYKNGQIGNEDLAFVHYLRIPYSLRKSTTWNNLGVSYQEFGMPVKSVEAYRKAADSGETLAMSNLAYKFMEVGFQEEAKRELDRALAVENFHKNVGQAVAALKAAPEVEEKKRSEFLIEAADKAKFYRTIGRALSQKRVEIDGTWEGPVCVLKVSVVDMLFDAFGQFETSGSNSLFSTAEADVVQRTVRYSGKRVGNRIAGSVRRKSDGGSKGVSTMLGLATDTDTTFLIAVSEDGQSLDVMENIRARKPSFYRLRRVGDTTK